MNSRGCDWASGVNLLHSDTDGGNCSPSQQPKLIHNCLFKYFSFSAAAASSPCASYAEVQPAKKEAFLEK